MSIYYIEIINDNNISNKTTTLSSRIAVNLEINVNIESITYDNIDKKLAFTFSSALTEFQLKTLNNLVNIIVEEKTVDDIYPDPRIIKSTRSPDILNDNLNGYTIGCISTNILINSSSICQNNNTGIAIWKSITTINKFIYDTPGTYNQTIDSSYNFIEIWLQGAGGSGGTGFIGTSCGAGGSGGSGVTLYRKVQLLALNNPTTYTITIGTGGSSQMTVSTSGSVGQSSTVTFNSLIGKTLTAYGGGGGGPGTSSGSGGSGGMGGNGGAGGTSSGTGAGSAGSGSNSAFLVGDTAEPGVNGIAGRTTNGPGANGNGASNSSWNFTANGVWIGGKGGAGAYSTLSNVNNGGSSGKNSLMDTVTTAPTASGSSATAGGGCGAVSYFSLGGLGGFSSGNGATAGSKGSGGGGGCGYNASSSIGHHSGAGGNGYCVISLY